MKADIVKCLFGVTIAVSSVGLALDISSTVGTFTYIGCGGPTMGETRYGGKDRE